MCLHALVEGALACVAERRMTQIVGQRDRLAELLIEPEAMGDAARHLGHFDGMREPRAKQVALVIDKQLGLVLQPSKGGAVDDPFPVAPVLSAV